MPRSPSPSGSSSSESSSASSSSSSSRSSSASAAQAIGAQSQQLEQRPTHGEKLPFEPPAGYEPAAHSRNVLSSFGLDALSQRTSGQQKQLWCFKVPDGISPAQLNGLVIPIPSAHSDQTLQQVELDEPNARGKDKRLKLYSLRLRRGEADEMDSAQGIKGKNRRKEAHTGHEKGMTQLIAMAGGNQVLRLESEGGEENGNEEMQGMQVMVPTGDEGHYVFAPIAISQHMQLMLEAPTKADITSRETAPTLAVSTPSTEASEKSKKHQQPWEKLNGFFHPSGARDPADEEDTELARSFEKPFPKKRKTSETSSPKKGADASPSKKHKEDKKKSEKGKESKEDKEARRKAKREKKAAKVA